MHGSDLEPHENHGALTERRVAGFQWNTCHAVDVVHRPEAERPHVDAEVDRKAPWGAQIDAAVDAFIAAVAQDPVLTVTISRELPVFAGLRSALWEKDIDLYAAFHMKLSRGPRMRAAGVRPLSSEKAIILVGGLSELIDRCLRTGGLLEAAGDEMKQTMKLIIGPR